MLGQPDGEENLMIYSHSDTHVYNVHFSITIAHHLK